MAIITLADRALGGAIEFQIAVDDPTRATEATDALATALAWLRAAEARLSRFQPTSELCALNATAGTWFHASRRLFAIVQAALAWADRTNGLFDPTILHALAAAGYDRDFGAMDRGLNTKDTKFHEGHENGTGTRTPQDGVANAANGVGLGGTGRGRSLAPTQRSAILRRGGPPCPPGPDGDPLPPRDYPRRSARAGGLRSRRPIGAVSTARAPGAAPAYTHIRLDPRHRRIRLPPGVGIDLGGIGKGWLADQLVEHVLGSFSNVLVNLGGDLRVRGGPEPGQGWIIGVRDPRKEGQDPPAYLGGVTLTSGGIATSGPGWRWWLRPDQTPAHHLIDPRTGQPAAHITIAPLAGAVIAATALAATAEAADVLAKYALLLDPADGLAMLNGGADHAGLLIMGDGVLRASANLREYLAAHRVER